MTQAFQNYLANKDIQSSYINDDQTVLRFDINNVHYLFYYRQDADPTYIRIMIPNIANVDENNVGEILTLLRLSQSYKVGKALIENGQLWLATDAFIYTRENINLVFDRLISVLNDMFSDYRMNQHEQE